MKRDVSYDMDPKQDIEMEQDESLTSSPRPLRKTIAIKLKSNKSPSSGRRKSKGARSSKKEETEPSQAVEPDVVDTPIFKPMDPGEPVHQSKRLCWNHKVNLIGEKVVDPMIHCCEKCSLPILIYGRMIQCKHVFCFTCAKETEKTCPRCKEPVQRIEQSALGTVFLCTYGGSKHSNDGCRRTYLSQRDLNAHIQHRHLKAEGRTQEQGGAKAPSSSQSHRQPLTQPPPKQTVSPASAQALLEQFTAAVRQAHAAQAAQTAQALREAQAAQAAHVVQAASVSRTSQEDPYQRGKDIGHMTQSVVVSSAPLGMPHQMLHQTAPPHSLATPYGQTSMPPVQTSMPPVSLSLAQQQSSAHDNYPSSIPVMTGGRTNVTNLITVPIQDNDYGRKQEQQPPPQSSFPASMPPPLNFPPPPLGQMPPGFPTGSVPPGMPPPGMPPPFSSQSIPGVPMGNPIYSSTRPPPHNLPPGGPPVGPGAGPRQGPPRMSMPPPGGATRYPSQGVQPRPPWPGGPPPRGPPGPGGPRGPAGGLPPPRPPQRADYNYY